MLEYPQYTLPKVFEGKEIPDILFTGNHKMINRWRLKESLKITKQRRSDLFDSYKLSKEEQELLNELEKYDVPKWEMDAIYKSKKNIVHDIKMDEKYYCLIKNGNKIYELRMNDEKRKLYKKGDLLCFLKRPDLEDFFYKKIKNLHYFKTYENLADSLDIKLTGFDSKDELVKTMNEIYKDKLGEFDVVAIELENIGK